MKLIHVSYAGPFHKIIDVNGKEWLFEMHNYFGPIALRKDGEPRAVQPSFKSQFWECVTCWAQQGENVDENNYCKYTHHKA